jgi:hypothetical protein
MSNDVSFTVSTDPSRQYRVLCPRCGVQTIHRVRASVDEHGVVDDSVIQWWAQYEIVQCQGCETISFRQDDQNTEEEVYSRDGDCSLARHEKLYPPRVAGRETIQNLHFIPYRVRRVYEETHNAIASQMQILGGIGIRALVESVCREKEAPGRNLDQQIDGLGVLTQAGADILHGTRLLGNIAAHEQEPISPDLLNAAMDVAEHLLHTVYILPAIAANLPRRGGGATPAT